MQHQISDAKNKLRDAEAYRQLVGSYFEQTVADVYELYERELHRMNAMDFDDLLVRTVNVLELFPEVRDRYAAAFRHVLVDEYQDTNHAQYRWLQLLAGEHRNLAVVGDDDQCLVEGTPITMGDGIDQADRGGARRRRGAVVLRQRRHPPGARHRRVLARAAPTASAITHARRPARSSARPSTRTSPATGSALTPQLHMTYLMRRRDKGFRVGTTRTYTDGQVKPVVGVAAALRPGARRRRMGRVDARQRGGGARRTSTLLSLRYGLPTLPFVAAHGGTSTASSATRR